MHMRFPLSAAATSVAAAALFLAPAASAHDAVIGGSPANGDVVETFPSTLELTFSSQPKEGFNTFALSKVGEAGTDVLYTGEPVVSGQDVALDLPGDLNPEPGEYQIGFQIVSSDGHATKGMTTFTYAPNGAVPAEAAAANTAAATTEATTSEEPSIADQGESSNLTLLLSIIGLVVIAGVAIAAMGKRRQARKLEERTILDPDPDTRNSK